MINPNYERTWRDYENKRVKSLRKAVAAGLSGLALIAASSFVGRAINQPPEPIKAEQSITADGLLKNAPIFFTEESLGYAEKVNSAALDSYVAKHPVAFRKAASLVNAAEGLEGRCKLNPRGLAAVAYAESKLRGRNKGQITRVAYDEVVKKIPTHIKNQENPKYNKFIAVLFDRKVPALRDVLRNDELNIYVMSSYYADCVSHYTNPENNPHGNDPRVLGLFEYNWGNSMQDIIRRSKNPDHLFANVKRLIRVGVATAYLDGVRLIGALKAEG